MGSTTKTQYDTDFVEWTVRTVELLHEGRLHDADLEHIAEEIEDLGNSERSAVSSQLHRMLKRLLKQQIEPERDGTSWKISISEARSEIEYKMDHSPSLRRYAAENLQRIYRRAVRDALFEANISKSAEELSLPAKCPYTLDDLLEGDLNALWPR